MLYKQKQQHTLNESLFKNPTSEYRGAPFWALNCKLEEQELLRQIDIFKEMGLGGFHLHSRSGLATPYLSNEFFDMIKACHKKAVEEDMICYLYDEDRWPSGFGGGFVTKNRKYSNRFLVICPYKNNNTVKENNYGSSSRALRSGEKTLLARYEIHLKDGYLHSYKKLALNNELKEEQEEFVWDVYLELSDRDPWFNNESYVDTLNKEAIDSFIQITHEKYLQEVGENFGKTIPSIFTDEPQFCTKENLDFANSKKEIALPFTDDFDITYKKTYGYSIFDSLPELIWDYKNKISTTRYHYHDHICERFVTAFTDNIGEWCHKNGLALTGHMMHEESLQSQTCAVGEAMRGYRSFQLPGIDILCDQHEFSTAKQAQSAARQYGRAGVMSELYGVTNWDFDFRKHKLQGDWQAALGITLRVHHLTWVSMAGEAKRDYPASIGYQSPWYKEYSIIENHFARLNTALTRGKAIARIGVIHPIESYWLYFGTNEKTSGIRDEMETNFHNIIKWLLEGLMDFDFICESLLASMDKQKNKNTFHVNQMEYDVVIVPNCKTLRKTTMERLKIFKENGGKIIFAGEVPEYMDALESKEINTFSLTCERVVFSNNNLLKAIETYREIDIYSEDGKRVNNLIYQLRQDNDGRWLFICNSQNMPNPDIAHIEKLTIIISGEYKPKIYDTITGEIYDCNAIYEDNKTIIMQDFADHSSLLLFLEPGRTKSRIKYMAMEKQITKTEYLPQPFEIELSEPNVVLLDTAYYAFDNEQWQPKDEILRIDNKFRTLLHYPLRMEAWAQPWTIKDTLETNHVLSLKFEINISTEIHDAELALENADTTEIYVNGTYINTKPVGYYTDKCLGKIKLPTLHSGTNEIILKIPFNQLTNVEYCYLLGNFSVEVQGQFIYIHEHKKTIPFGDYTNMGLPFYGGNVTYKCKFISDGSNIILQASHYRAPLLSVALDGRQMGKLIFSPYQFNLGFVPKGEHILEITSFGNRINSFGTLHNANSSTTWFGPGAWRTTGSSWAYEYILKPTGILTTPMLLGY